MSGSHSKISGLVAVVALLVIGHPRPSRAQDTLPIGFGTLHRDDIAVPLTTDQLQIQVLPLDQQVIRLLAPDTYRSLSDLMATRRSAVDSAAQRGGEAHVVLVLVTLYGLVPQARFSPEDLNITSRGRLYRPVGVVPLSPRWNSYQLDAREQAVALYLFDEGLTFREVVTVSYQNLSSDAWSRSARMLDQERARVLARAGVQTR